MNKQAESGQSESPFDCKTLSKSVRDRVIEKSRIACSFREDANPGKFKHNDHYTIDDWRKSAVRILKVVKETGMMPFREHT